MTKPRTPALIFALCAASVACVGGGGDDPVLPSDGGNAGHLVVGDNHPTLDRDGLTTLRTAQTWTVRRELHVGGRQLEERQQDSGRLTFPYTGFASNTRRSFELVYYGEFRGREVELLSATGVHTFRTYASDTCKPSRENDCSQVAPSADGSTSIEQALEIQRVFVAHCDDDERDNLTEIYFNTDPCDPADDPNGGQIAAAIARAPLDNAVLPSTSPYRFRFSATADDLHTRYLVQVFDGEDPGSPLASSSAAAVLPRQLADYSVDLSADLRASRRYSWRVFGVDADQNMRPLSPAYQFRVAAVVPSLQLSAPGDHAVLPYAEAADGHRFRFGSSSHAGVHEYRLHLTDETHHVDYGYKRVPASGLRDGEPISTVRNLALSHGARHRWRVSAHDARGDQLAQTAAREFTVEAARAVDYQLQPLSPDDAGRLYQVAQARGYDFSFSSATNDGVQQYRLHLRDTSNGLDYGYKEVPASPTGVHTTTRNLTLRNGAEHRWYVTANGADGAQLDQSAESRFSVETQAINTVIDLDDARNLAERPQVPAAQGYPFYFRSSSDTGVWQYRLYLEQVGGPSYGYKIIPSRGEADGGAYSTTRQLDLAPGAEHRYQVAAVDFSGDETYSSPARSFRVLAGAAPGIEPRAPTGALPWASAGIGYRFSFEVDNADAVASYRIHLRDLDTPADFGYKEIDAAASTGGGVAATTRNVATNSGARHQWHVTAHDARGAELARSDAVDFTPTAPDLTAIAPLEGARVPLSDSGYPFRFESSDDAGVAEYRVHVHDVSNGNTAIGYKSVPPRGDSGAASYTVERRITLLANARNRWRVAALDAAGIEIHTTDWVEFSTVP